MFPNFPSLRVIEVGTTVSVPAVGAVLSNLGAEVIKLESRHKLDNNRVRPRKGAGGEITDDDSFPLWHEFNPGKKSVLANLKSEIGKEVFLSLLDQSDVFLQNFAPGWLERLGLSIEQIQERNPQLIILSASGYGQTGPKASQRVYAPVMTALGGQEALVGYDNDTVQGAVVIAFGDLNAAFNGVLMLMSALYHRERSGMGCHIDLAQIQAVTTNLGEGFVEMQLTGKPPEPIGNASFSRAPHGIYPCDGDDHWATISVRSEHEWAALQEAVRRTSPEVADELARPEWNTLQARVAGREALDAVLSEWTKTLSRQALPELLQSVGVRSAPVYESNESEHDPHLIARDFTREIPVRDGVVKVTSTPWRIDGRTPVAREPGPKLGNCTVEVLTRLCGMSEADVERYIEEGHLA